jgi:hypothetical protein
MHGHSDEEAMWTSLSAWDNFQPRQARPRSESGELYYPDEFSHVIEKYWNFLPALDQQPEFPQETSYCQEHMIKFSAALSKSRLDEFQPNPVAEAKQVDVEIAEDAAVSRLLPI